MCREPDTYADCDAQCDAVAQCLGDGLAITEQYNNAVFVALSNTNGHSNRDPYAESVADGLWHRQ